MKKKKKLLPLISSLTLLSAPIVLVTACSYEINRYQAALPNDLQNRILFDFIGVNYSVDAKSHFSSIYKQGMEFIKKEVEGIMAQQEFFNFFTKKLGYSDDLANATFTEIKDTLGLNILAADYFNTINSGKSFDSKDTTKLIFQTDNWHQFGTTRFDYQNTEFYRKNNPNEIFTASYLYSDLTDQTKDDTIKEVAKHADDQYHNEISKLTENKLKWDSPTTPVQTVPDFDSTAPNGVQEYQKKLERFKWWLRFRYQQYYYSVILPELNQTLFSMANILDTILRINVDGNKRTVQIDNSKYAGQLQKWGPNETWTSNYRFVWDYTTNKNTALAINKDWSNPDETKNTALPDLMLDEKTLNPKFLNRLAATDKTLKTTVDPVFGINGFVSDPSSKPYSTNVQERITSGWPNNTDGTHFWIKDNKGSFAYAAPIYWIDVVQNLNFNFYQKQSTENQLIVNTADDYKGLISRWKLPENSSTSNSKFSQYLRADYLSSTTPSDQYITTQKMKWNLFWQMIYSLAAQVDSNANKKVAEENFTAAAKVLFPKYIKKENIYNIDFWNAVSSYY
ncbi:MAG: hypothetical protein REH79_03260 [Spiroplasma sp.]|nr:hypothetical protein [Spiroplasma sp.]